MSLYYETIEKDGWEWEKIPITINDTKRILSECKIIDIEAKEPFPEGKVTFVGVGNDNYECHTLWDMKYYILKNDLCICWQHDVLGKEDVMTDINHCVFNEYKIDDYFIDNFVNNIVE